ncbi:hypothetical protein D3C80_1660150 [compost metagenome]
MRIVHTELNQHERLCIDDPDQIHRLAEILQCFFSIIISNDTGVNRVVSEREMIIILLLGILRLVDFGQNTDTIQKLS